MTNYLQKTLPGNRAGKQTLDQAVSQYQHSKLQNSSQPLSGSTPNGVNGSRPAVDCPLCKDEGMVRVDDGLAFIGTYAPCTCLSKKAARYAKSLNKMTEAEKLYRLDDIDGAANGQGTRDMLTAARTFLSDPVWMLTIHGTPGNAKSVAMIAMVNELNERGIPAYYTTLLDLMEMVRQAYRHDDNKNRVIRSEDAYDLLMRFCEARVLAIDEFDKVTSVTDWVLQTMTALIDNRYRDGERIGTIIALNKNIDFLPEWIADRLMDGRNRHVVNNDPSLRHLMRR